MNTIPQVPEGKKIVIRTLADGTQEVVCRKDPFYGRYDARTANGYMSYIIALGFTVFCFLFIVVKHPKNNERELKSEIVKK